MKDSTKKMAAALAAVNAYLQDEAHIQQSQNIATDLQPAMQDLNVWALSGRQDMMSMRQLIQMKAFTRF